MILAVLQARMSSTRLPGKVVKPILGRPMLIRQIERIQRAKCIDQFIVATSNHPDDSEIEELCNAEKINCFRGAMDDVLDRIYKAALCVHPKYVIRLTGDCPLVEPDIIDKLVQYFLEKEFDYASNTINPTWPDGLDVEIMGYECLEKSWKEAKLLSEREHVTPYIYNHPEKFNIGSFENEKDLSHMRWTVDEPADFELINKIYENLYIDNSNFTITNILELLENNPELLNINNEIKRNEGYSKSLINDKNIKLYNN